MEGVKCEKLEKIVIDDDTNFFFFSLDLSCLLERRKS